MFFSQQLLRNCVAPWRLRGFGLIETVVGIALLLVVFLSLLGVLRASLMVSTHAKSKATATALAQSQIEYLRGLSYDDLGTVGGIPGGSIPQVQTSEIGGVTYTIRTFVEYKDDPADGLGGADETGIITDYKLGKVEVTYALGDTVEKEVSMLSTFAPPSLETSTGGGTLQVLVVNAEGAGVSDAEVEIVNTAITPAVNLTTYSNVNGVVFLPGAATSSAYEISVTKSGY